jgi:hypothetical protein
VRQSVPTAAASDEPAVDERGFTGDDGRRWRVEVGGRSRVGRRGESGVPVLLLLFRPEEAAPDAAPVLEVLAPGEELEGFSESRLAALVDEAEPFRAIEPRGSPEGGRRSSSRRDRSPRGESGRRSARKRD